METAKFGIAPKGSLSLAIPGGSVADALSGMSPPDTFDMSKTVSISRSNNLDVNEAGDVVVHIEVEVFTDATKIKWDENELSSVVVIHYGAFRYYEGVDQEAHRNKIGEIEDTITHTAKAAGPVDVATLPTTMVVLESIRSSVISGRTQQS